MAKRDLGIGEGGAGHGGTRLEGVEDAFAVELGRLGIQNGSRISASLTAGRRDPKRDGEVGLEDFLDAAVLHARLRHLALLGGARLNPLQSLPHDSKARRYTTI
jgi:hypothetical protein